MLRLCMVGIGLLLLPRLLGCHSTSHLCWAWTSSCKQKQAVEWDSTLGKCCHQEGDWCHQEVEYFMVVYVGQLHCCLLGCPAIALVAYIVLEEHPSPSTALASGSHSTTAHAILL
eukprot:3178291-Amphidinium_carterae.1